MEEKRYILHLRSQGNANEKRGETRRKKPWKKARLGTRLSIHYIVSSSGFKKLRN